MALTAVKAAWEAEQSETTHKIQGLLANGRELLARVEKVEAALAELGGS